MTLFPRAAGLAAVLLAVPAAALAHGFAGDRFFPATIATDDPFVSDELSLPTVQTQHNSSSADGPSNQETDLSVDLSKRITQDFGLGVGYGIDHIDPKYGKSTTGLDNLDLNAKYLVLENDPHEFLFSVGLDAGVGGTGSSTIGANNFSTITPQLFLGKGMGDLPDNLKFLKPLAVTGVFGISVPTASRTVDSSGDVDYNATSLGYGLAFEYSLPYLQSHVEDIGLPDFVAHLIPLTEIALSTPLNGGISGETTGTINPGVAWIGQYNQITAEAILPVNSRTSNGIGGVVQLHFFLDDLFPHSIGAPLLDQPLFGG